MIFAEHTVGWIGAIVVFPDEILIFIRHDEVTALLDILCNNLKNRFDEWLLSVQRRRDSYFDFAQDQDGKVLGNLIK
jgi:hypothetical protein